MFISPDGVYNQINLEAIPTPDGKYVIDDSNIVIVSNTKDLYIRKQRVKVAGSSQNNNSATMFGNPTFYLEASTQRTISQLPGTDKEVRGLDELLKQQGWKTSEYLESDATEEQVKQVESPSVLHIATHGFYTPELEPSEGEELTENEAMLSENPLLKTGLLLRGAGDVFAETKFNYNIKSGVLTASEAMNLNLDKTDLVVLSACETGLGDVHNGEGVYGLQRAFLVAGAKVLIMSMFKVDDEATQKLVDNFYRKWTTTKNMRKSFIDAKKEIRTEYPEPIYWGAFMMIGLD
ncbi:MAG: CHAT domain-containing protein [Bacteroidota bacterium]